MNANQRGDLVGGAGSGHAFRQLLGDAAIQPQGLDGGCWLNDDTILSRQGVALVKQTRASGWTPQSLHADGSIFPAGNVWFAGGDNFATTLLSGSRTTTGVHNGQSLPIRYQTGWVIADASRDGALLFVQNGQYEALWPDGTWTPIGAALEARLAWDGGAVLLLGPGLTIVQADGSRIAVPMVSTIGANKPALCSGFVSYACGPTNQRFVHGFTNARQGWEVTPVYAPELHLLNGHLRHAGSLREGELPGDLVVDDLTRPVSDVIVKAASLVVPEFPRTDHPMWPMIFAQPGARYKLIGDDEPISPAVRGRFYTIGRDDLAKAINDCQWYGLPLYAYWDNRGYTPERVPVIEGVRVIALLQCYPNRPQAEIRSEAQALAQHGDWAIVPSLYDQSGYWPRQAVLDYARFGFDLAVEFKATAICPYVWERRGTGMTDVPEFMQAGLRLLDAIPNVPVWPPHVNPPPPPPPKDDSMPMLHPTTFPRADVAWMLAFANYPKILTFTANHPDFRAIADDRERMFKYTSWLMDSWDTLVAKPNAEGYASALRETLNGKTFDWIIDTMGLERRGL